MAATMTMMINGDSSTAICATIILAGSNRTRLMQQTALSYNKHTSRTGGVHSLIVLSDSESGVGLRCASRLWDEIEYTPHLKGRLGAARNYAARKAIAKYNPIFLHFVDDDVYFRRDWFDAMHRILLANRQIAIVGGDRHPYHKPIRPTRNGFEETDAVAGYSMFMRAGTFSYVGGFPEEGMGVGASEDWAICQKVRERGWLVGYAASRPVLHCGLTNSSGKRATGAAEILANRPIGEDVKGVIYE